MGNTAKREIFSKQQGFTLMELLVVLAIIGAVFSLGIFGILKVRQVILVTNTTKELRNNLKKARRFALDSVVTSDQKTSTAFYIEIDDANDEFYWGECDEINCNRREDLKSAQYTGIKVSGCGGHSIIKFTSVTGEFIITDSAMGSNLVSGECMITITGEGAMMKTSSVLHVNVEERTFITE